MKKRFARIVILELFLLLNLAIHSGCMALFPVQKGGGERITNSIGMTFVYIEPGTFVMGSPEDERDRYADETQHKVTLTKGFFMQTTEVTQGQWKQVMEHNPSEFKDCGDDCPVENVSWNDVHEFILKLNRTEGTDKYRLPTEAQWEYACRAGTTTTFAFGACLNTDQANYDGNYPLEGCAKGEFRKRTVRVKSFPPNDWGLYDMHGNVYEWCADWYGAYPDDPVVDPKGPERGILRVLRVGSWYDDVRFNRSASRYRHKAGYRDSDIGFRLVRDP